MRRRTVLGTGFALLTASALPWAGKAGARGMEHDAALVLYRLSAVRRDAGLPDLDRRTELAEMARVHALHLQREGSTTHVGADGSDPVARAWQAGYSGRVLGETLAETYDGPVETVDLWLAHDQTRAVLLDPMARDVGIFGLREGTGRVWWDLVVGTRHVPERGGPASPSLH